MTTETRAKHTPGPWAVGYSQGITGPTASQWHYMPGWEEGQFSLVSKPDAIDQGTAKYASVVCVLPRADRNADENARRIVAAVNALEGFSTEAIEQGVIKELLAVVPDLLDMAESWVEWLRKNVGPGQGEGADELFARTRAATAKAEGREP